MLLEGISFSFNLSLFTSLIWSLVSLQDNRLANKLKKFPLFLAFSISFYFIFYLSSLFHLKIFELKHFYFSGYVFLIQLLFLGLIFIISKRSLESHAPVLSIVLAPYLFFLLFGVEEFHIEETVISSYSLLKTQNPIIGVTALILILIKPNKIQILGFFILLSLLFFQVNPLKEFPFPEIRIVYYKYIPHEFFLKDNAYLFEENSGIYTEKKMDMDDVLYKFTMRPIKKLKLPLKQEIQTLISKFEFPIIVTDGNIITLLELSRSYNGYVFQVIFHIDQIPDSAEIVGDIKNIDTATVRIVGPIF